MLAARSLVKQAKSLNIAGEQLAELKERGDGAERDLVRRSTGPTSSCCCRSRRARATSVRLRGDRPERADRAWAVSSTTGCSRASRTTSSTSITPQKLVGLLNFGDGDDQAAVRRLEEVVDAVFSYLQFPKLKEATAVQGAIADGVTRGVFGYVPLASSRRVER